MPARARLLYVTDLAYPARGRRYCDEDIFLTSRLRADFDLALCHPLDATALMDGFDSVVVRNSGPVLHYQKAYDAFRERATALGTPVYNPLTGRVPGHPHRRPARGPGAAARDRRVRGEAEGRRGLHRPALRDRARAGGPDLG